jgi:hypothetical protein
MKRCRYCERKGGRMISVDCSGVGEALVRVTRNARRMVRQARCILVFALVLMALGGICSG